jgi:hypothetical protein
MTKTLKQTHKELLDHLDISPTLKAIIFQGIIRNERAWLTQKQQEHRKTCILAKDPLFKGRKCLPEKLYEELLEEQQ